MAAGANPSGSTSKGNGTFKTNNKIINGGHSAALENSAVGPSERALKHPTIRLSLDWSCDEQSLLEQLLAKYASNSTVICYAEIATKLNNKTVRDVALRCKWMNKTENGKRRQDNGNLSNRQKAKKEKVADQNGNASSHAINHANGLPYAQLSTSMDDGDDGIPKKYADIGGELGKRFEQNDRAMNQISANFSPLKVHENISLISQTRNNMVALLNELNDIKNMPDLMKQMPPLSLKVNDELVNSIIHQSSMPMKLE